VGRRKKKPFRLQKKMLKGGKEIERKKKRNRELSQSRISMQRSAKITVAGRACAQEIRSRFQRARQTPIGCLPNNVRLRSGSFHANVPI
jgi:hypothetical protein